MKVVHLSTYDVSGGAAIAAYRLHCGLRAAEVDSRMLVKHKKSGDGAVAKVQKRRPEALWHRLVRERMARFQRERFLDDGTPDDAFHDIRTEFRPEDFESISDADVVHLHWVCGLLDWPTTLLWLAAQKPVVWTLHDMHPILGALNYHDPSVPLPKAFEAMEQAVCRRKKQIWAAIPAHRLNIVAPSLWMMDLTQSSSLSKFKCHHIPSGLDTDAFTPMDKRGVRSVLGIPSDKTIIGFVAQDLTERRKGMAVLAQALRSLDTRSIKPLLLTAGAACADIQGVESLHLGSLESERMLSLFYNALDLFICPSLQDNLPNTVMEAMSCGIPVVAFDTGGISDMVRTGETGWLVERVGDASALAASITRALSNADELRQRGAAARVIAEQEYGSTARASEMIRLYRALLDIPDHLSIAKCKVRPSAFVSPS